MGTYIVEGTVTPVYNDPPGPIFTTLCMVGSAALLVWATVYQFQCGRYMYGMYLIIFGCIPAGLVGLYFLTKAMYLPFSRSTGQWRLLGFLSLVFLYLTAGLGAYQSLRSYHNVPIEGGWSVTSTANVRAEPSMEGKILSTVAPGEIVAFIEQTGEWIKINYASGFAFVHSTLLQHRVQDNYVWKCSPWLILAILSFLGHLVMLMVPKDLPPQLAPPVEIPCMTPEDSAFESDFSKKWDFAEMVADRTVSKIKHDKELEGQMMELGKKVIQRKTCEGCGGSLGIVNGNYVCDYCGTHYGSTRNLRI